MFSFWDPFHGFLIENKIKTTKISLPCFIASVLWLTHILKTPLITHVLQEFYESLILVVVYPKAGRSCYLTRLSIFTFYWAKWELEIRQQKMEKRKKKTKRCIRVHSSTPILNIWSRDVKNERSRMPCWPYMTGYTWYTYLCIKEPPFLPTLPLFPCNNIHCFIQLYSYAYIWRLRKLYVVVYTRLSQNKMLAIRGDVRSICVGPIFLENIRISYSFLNYYIKIWIFSDIISKDGLYRSFSTEITCQRKREYAFSQTHFGSKIKSPCTFPFNYFLINWRIFYCHTILEFPDIPLQQQPVIFINFCFIIIQ